MGGRFWNWNNGNCWYCEEPREECKCKPVFSEYVPKSDLRKLVEDMSRYMKQGKGKTQKLTTEHWKYRVKKLLNGGE